jgi:hypothetical protein
VSQGCSRPACGGGPAGRVLLDTRSRLVVIDDRTNEHGGVAILCADHLARLRPARGWRLVDQRAERPELFEEFDESGAESTGEIRRRRRGDKPKRPKLADTVDQLEFDASASYALPESYDRVARRDAPSAADAASTPLLARAFEASRRRGE